MPLSLAQFEQFKKKAFKTDLSEELSNSERTSTRNDILHILLGSPQIPHLVTKTVEATLQPTELKHGNHYTFPAELVFKIIDEMEVEHFADLMHFIRTRFKTDWLINASDPQLSPSLSR